MGERLHGVRLLLDTHAFLWAVANPEKLSAAASEAIRSTDNELFLSSASAWELATKHRIGKLPQAELILDDIAALAADLMVRHLPITLSHAVRAGLMTAEHRDPFDRMLAAQAQIERLHVVTRDPALSALGVNVVW